MLQLRSDEMRKPDVKLESSSKDMRTTRGRTRLDVAVACAIKIKLGTVNENERYELNVALSEEPSNRDRK